MIVQLRDGLSTAEESSVLSQLSDMGCKVTPVVTQLKKYLVVDPKKEIDIRSVGQLKGVRDVHRVNAPYKLVSRKWRVAPSAVSLGDGVQFAEGELTIAAGPCSIEDERQIDSVIAHLKEIGVRIMRGGVYKPRTSPYSFRGVGLEGLKMWHEKAREAGIKVVTEVLATDQIESMHDYVDMFQVGARNAQNFTLLAELGKVDKPVLLKRGMSTTLDEFLHAAEYIFSSGNEKLVLCERGIRTFERAYRNTLDINAVPALKERTHLPVVVDPSHGIGVRRWVRSVALAAVIAGCDGLILEVAPIPEKAFSDGQQTLNFKESRELIEKAQQLIAIRREDY
ncbi:MAG: 3-deoxy-7-phosphoheptulonate synthase [Bdellovibrionales bacterium]|nr:3-deoxy-7-phosphoheptulonate synthase [Bdellovibrionales bacterium]